MIGVFEAITVIAPSLDHLELLIFDLLVALWAFAIFLQLFHYSYSGITRRCDTGWQSGPRLIE